MQQAAWSKYCPVRPIIEIRRFRWAGFPQLCWSQRQECPRNFSVSLKCDQAVDITVNVNADSDAPAQGLINANQGSQAKGFVVELREHRADGSSTPFVLNTDHQYSNNGRDDTVLSFRARLKKKSATGAIALGDFSALATIQLSYE